MSQTATVSQTASQHEAWKELRARAPTTPARRPDDRVVWFDYAKGICITLVVMMHSTLGVGDVMGGEGFLHEVVAFARPFRMPDFFLLSGLFLFRIIDRDWRTYLDRKLIHFGYFYLLWLVILTVVKHGAELGADAHAWTAAFGEAIETPNPNLWFIYLLPLFFLTTKLARSIGMPGWALWLGAAALQTFPPHTGWEALDDYGARYYVFFLTGYLLAPQVFKLAAWVREHMAEAAIALCGWFSFNAVIAFSESPVSGYAKVADVPSVRIAVGLIGAMAVVAAASLLSRMNWAGYLRYAGRNSIVLYVSFVLPMAATRILLLKSGLTESVGVVSLIVTLVAIAVPLALHAAVRNTWARFLFERPQALKFERRRERDRGAGWSQRSRSRTAAGWLTGATGIPIFPGHEPIQSLPQEQKGVDLLRARRRGHAHRQGQPRLPGRRLRVHLPRLPRATPLDAPVRRHTRRGRARLLRHAVEVVARN